MKKQARVLLAIILCVAFLFIFSMYKTNAYKDPEPAKENLSKS